MVDYLKSAWISHVFLAGTVVQLTAAPTRPNAFMSPNPNLLLNQSPAAFCCHPGLSATGANSEVHTIRCWTSLQVKFGLQKNNEL